MSRTVVTVEQLSKKYLVGHQSAPRERYTALRDAVGREVGNFARKTADLLRGRQIVQGDVIEEFWALRNVSFQVKQGEVLGIIGRNGAGKSTLLKILSRITEPTSGSVRIRRRVASLLEVGTGFHPELTGRENIFLNGAILGMSRSEISRKFDEIVAFAEVERFIDTPVKRYSSGMYVRLAFAVAAHLEPDIFIIDEVLAVGDVEFQRKCLGKMEEVSRGEGRTILFVSHNMAAVQTLCSRAILLAQGKVHYDGDAKQAVECYLRTSHPPQNLWTRTRAVGDKRARIERIDIQTIDGEPRGEFSSKEVIIVQIRITCMRPVPSSQLSVRIVNGAGVVVLTTTNTDHAGSLLTLQPGSHRFRFQIPDTFLSAGRYALTASLCIPRIEVVDEVAEEVTFAIVDYSSHAVI